MIGSIRNSTNTVKGSLIYSTNTVTNTLKGGTNAVTNTLKGGTHAVTSTLKGGTHAVTSTLKSGTGAVTSTLKSGTGAIIGGTSAVTNTLKSGTGAVINTLKRSTGLRGLHRQGSRLAWDSRLTAPFIKLDLVIECRRLPKKDSFCQADAFCGVWEVPPGFGRDKKVSKLPGRQEREIGRTEVVRANKDPKFKTTFRLEYQFQLEQTYIVRVYDEDLKYATDLKEHDFIGGAVFTLGELFGAPGCTIARPLQRGKAFLVLTGEEIVETREVLEFRFSGQNLGTNERRKKQVAKEVLERMEKLNVAKTVLEKFDPFFQLEKHNSEDHSWAVIWKSEVIKDNQNPTWNVARLPLQLLCDDDPSKDMKIAIWDWNRFTPDEAVGVVDTTVSELVQKSMRGIPTFPVMLEKTTLFRGIKQKKNGVLKVLKANIISIPSMLQYIAGGCELEVTFAVDCTQTNGNWKEETSLHYHSPTWMNDYQAVIRKIAKLYSPYCQSHGYSLWGYGGRVNNAAHPYFVMAEHAQDIETIMKAYENTFADDNDSLEMGRHADMKPVIQAAMYRAIRLSQIRQCYSTLVILSTGSISDIQATIDALCTAAEDAPISVVVIGIGTASFKDLEHLMGDEETGKLRHSNGVPIARDVVHCASFRDYHGNASSCAAEALCEIPEQFVQHFVNCGVKPMPPYPVPDFTSAKVFGKSAS